MTVKKESPAVNRAGVKRVKSSLEQTTPLVKERENASPARLPETPAEIEAVILEAKRTYHREYQRANKDKVERYQKKHILKKLYGVAVAVELMNKLEAASKEGKQ